MHRRAGNSPARLWHRSATTSNALPHWKVAADRFGVTPLSVEAWLARPG